ncbi:TraR/DksA C4-type zinc finger protein [Streptomyces sp. Wb2n-11]|uniref:TraR/DksA family transcriptional regulator n=1 Tax=Streptomyces sp. Wb2n-11 TaxID=1030533 RepID=UPI000A6CC4D3|nr:TraR/DksA C4-type zinc finger protein [Streptomyces sp. Wb2n-11]
MVAKKTAAQSADGAGTAGKDPVVEKTAVKKAAANKTDAKKTDAKKTDAKRTDAKKTAAKKAAPAKKAPAEKAAAKRAAPAAKGAAQAAEETGAKTVVAKKATSRATAAKKTVAATATTLPKSRTAAPDELAVRPGEDPWTPDEVAGARAQLEKEVSDLRAEITASEEAVSGLMRDSGDGAGDDQADTGTKNISREYELALAASARERLEQTERALERLDAGTYGLCEVCGKPIGKARMQAFPRATLCVEDKQKQERRY